MESIRGWRNGIPANLHPHDLFGAAGGDQVSASFHRGVMNLACAQIDQLDHAIAAECPVGLPIEAISVDIEGIVFCTTGGSKRTTRFDSGESFSSSNKSSVAGAFQH